MDYLDLGIIKAIYNSRDHYERIIKSVSAEQLVQPARGIFAMVDAWYKDAPEATQVDTPLFKAWMTTKYTFTDEQKATYDVTINNLTKDVKHPALDALVRNLSIRAYANKVADLLAEYEDGADIDVLEELKGITDTASKDIAAQEQFPWVQTSLKDIFADADRSGLKWRLNTVSDHMQPLSKGTFGIVAGRPDKGKTTFIASEVTHMATQLDEDENIIWLNNEGDGKKIVQRLYMAALGCTVTELKEKVANGTADDEYIRVMGRLDKIRVLDIHGQNQFYIEKILDEMNPGLVIFDMLDKVKFRNTEVPGNDKYEPIYDWARDLCVIYQTVGIATSQISADGAGEPHPMDHMLKDSKTGKQGACDFIIMLGHYKDHNLNNIRTINIVKSKLRVDGMPQDPRAQVWFKPQTCRFEDKVAEIVEVADDVSN